MAQNIKVCPHCGFQNQFTSHSPKYCAQCVNDMDRSLGSVHIIGVPQPQIQPQQLIYPPGYTPAPAAPAPQQSRARISRDPSDPFYRSRFSKREEEEYEEAEEIIDEIAEISELSYQDATDSDRRRIMQVSDAAATDISRRYASGPRKKPAKKKTHAQVNRMIKELTENKEGPMNQGYYHEIKTI